MLSAIKNQYASSYQQYGINRSARTTNNSFVQTVGFDGSEFKKEDMTVSLRPSSLSDLAKAFRNSPIIDETELPADHFTKSDAYEKMVDSLTGVTYYKNKMKPEIQMTNDQLAKFYEFFGNDTMASINRHRELSGTRKVYGDYTVELFGTDFRNVAIKNSNDNSIIEFDLFGDPNNIFNELDNFLEGKKLTSDLFADFMDTYNSTKKTTEQEETNTEVFINPEGERILMIKTSFGVRYIKIGEATDFMLTDSKMHGNLEAAFESAYHIQN